MASSPGSDWQVDTLLSSHGLRRTKAARAAFGYLLAHEDGSFTHAQLLAAVQAKEKAVFDRGTLYRLVDRLAQVGLLTFRVDARSVRRYRAAPGNSHLKPRFECHSCYHDLSLDGELALSAPALQKAARAALGALQAMGYQDLSLDVAVRGVCADCAGAAGRARA